MKIQSYCWRMSSDSSLRRWRWWSRMLVLSLVTWCINFWWISATISRMKAFLRFSFCQTMRDPPMDSWTSHCSKWTNGGIWSRITWFKCPLSCRFKNELSSSSPTGGTWWDYVELSFDLMGQNYFEQLLASEIVEIVFSRSGRIHEQLKDDEPEMCGHRMQNGRSWHGRRRHPLAVVVNLGTGPLRLGSYPRLHFQQLDDHQRYVGRCQHPRRHYFWQTNLIGRSVSFRVLIFWALTR